MISQIRFKNLELFKKEGKMSGKIFFAEIIALSQCGAVDEESSCSYYKERPNSHGRCIFRGHKDLCLHPEAKKMQTLIKEIIREMFPEP